jgi:DNA primase large subunit
MLHRVPKAVTYEETLEALEDHFRDQHLAIKYCSQLKTRTQAVGESLQEFATAIKQLIHHGYQALPKDHIRRAASKAFAERVEDPAIIIQLLLEEEKTVNETLR